MRNNVQTHTHNRIQKTPFIISAKDDAIMQAVYTFRYLTAEQITRLFYSKGSLTYVRDMLTRLIEKKYLYRFHMPTTSPGVTPYVYTLASKGMKYLKESGMEAALRFRPSEANEVSYQHINHTLAVNDFLIAASLLPRSEPMLSLYDLRHEWYLKHTPLTIKVTDPQNNSKKEESITVVPDGFLDFRFQVNGKTQSMPIWVEIDRGTEAIRQFKRKIRGLLAAVYSPQYEALFNTKAVTIAFATTAQSTRLANMRSWITQELAELGKQGESSLFLCTKLPVGELDPKTLFLAPVWYLPSDNSPLSLLDLT